MLSRGRAARRRVSPAYWLADRISASGELFGQIDKFFRTLEEKGVLGRLDAMVLPGLAPAVDVAFLDPINQSAAAADVHGGTFTAQRGWAGNGISEYVALEWAFPGRFSEYQQNDAFQGIYANAGTDTASDSVRLCGSTSGMQINGRSAAGTLRGTCNDNTIANLTGGAGVATRLGFTAFERTGAAAIQGYRNGVANGSGTTASVALSTNRQVFLGATNSTGTPTSFSDNRICAWMAGRGLGATLHGDVYTALQALMTYVGAHV